MNASIGVRNIDGKRHLGVAVYAWYRVQGSGWADAAPRYSQASGRASTGSHDSPCWAQPGTCTFRAPQGTTGGRSRAADGRRTDTDGHGRTPTPIGKLVAVVVWGPTSAPHLPRPCPTPTHPTTPHTPLPTTPHAQPHRDSLGRQSPNCSTLKHSLAPATIHSGEALGSRGEGEEFSGVTPHTTTIISHCGQ